jgi:hypothetical protein
LIMAEDISTPTPTLDQTVALSRIGKAHDVLVRKVRQGLQLGLSPEKIIDFIDDQATQVSNRMLREILSSEVLVDGEVVPEAEEDADTADQDDDDDENAPTIVIKDDDDDPTIVIKDKDD